MRNASADFQFKLYDGFSGRSSSSGSALMYGGIGETIAEKSGILNIGMEGVMLSGAFFSFAGAWYSGNLFVGLLCGMAGGLIVSLASWTSFYYVDPEPVCFRSCHQHAYAWRHQLFV